MIILNVLWDDVTLLQCILCVSYVDESNILLVKRSQKKSLQDVKPTSVQPRKVDLLHRDTVRLQAKPCHDFSDIFYPWQEDTGHLRAVLSLLQSDVGANLDAQPPLDHKPDPNPKPRRPAWCKCDHCTPSSVPQEELCCRRSVGTCITSSPLFEQLVLSRSLLEAVLLYRDPLSSLADRGQTATLRHCAYRQYISWRFGVPPNDTHPVIPSCCVWRVREEYPSPDGQYSGFRPVRIASMQACTNGELWEECFCIADQGLPTDWPTNGDLMLQLPYKEKKNAITSLNWVENENESVFVSLPSSGGKNLTESINHCIF